MIKVIVCGACGKMGGQLVSLISQDKEMELVGVIERDDHPEIAKILICLPDLFVVKSEHLEELIEATEPDVVIEFTNPIVTIQHAAIASQYKKAMVIGTTGLSEEQISHLKELAKNFPCVMAPNMSAGVNLLFKLVKEVAKTLPGYDVEIVEAHHNQKKDAPSGTAKSLFQAVATGLEREVFPSCGRRDGIVGPRNPKEIGVHSIRGGDIVGEHTVIFAGPGERIELTHRAHSRDVFAYGAIKAAKWIVGKPFGLYDMQDVLGIK